MIVKRTINSLIFLSLILIPFQDSAFVDSPLGFLGIYLTTLPLLFAMCIDYGVKILNNAKINTVLLISILYCFVVSFVIGFCYFGVNIPTEGVKKTLTIPLLIIVYFYLAKKIVKIDILFTLNALKCCLIICVMSVVFWDFLNISDNFFLHYTSGFSRFSGYTREPSWFCALTQFCSLVILFFDRKKSIRMLSFVVFVIVTVGGGSKGALISALLSLVLFVFVYTKSIVIKYFIIFLIVCLFSFIVEGLSILFSNDIEHFTSFATRTSTILSSVFVIVKYPLGCGMIAANNITLDEIFNAFNVIENFLGIGINSKEIENYFIGNIYSNGLGIKSFLLQYSVYFGWPFVIFIIIVMKKALVSFKNDASCMYLLIFTFISYLCYANFSYIGCVIIGLLIKKYNLITIIKR